MVLFNIQGAFVQRQILHGECYLFRALNRCISAPPQAPGKNAALKSAYLLYSHSACTQEEHIPLHLWLLSGCLQPVRSRGG